MLRQLARFRHLRAIVLAAVAGTACGHLTDPPLPMDAEQFPLPPVYARWWAMVESCSGLTGSLDAIEWYAAPGPLTDPGSGDAINGYWSLASNRIVLDVNDTIDGALVRHEMLHALVRSAGHPRRYFLERCGGVVSCTVNCVRDAGDPLRDPSSIVVTPSQLIVTVEVSPTSPSVSIDGGMGTFTISVHNPFQSAIEVTLPGAGIDAPRSYGYDIREVSSGARVIGAVKAVDPGVTLFKAGETKRQIIDFLVIALVAPEKRISGLGDDGIALPPGSYLFIGDYGGEFAPNLNVVLSR